MHWCEQQLVAVGHPSPPIASEFISLGHEVFPIWYQDLLFRACAHCISGHQSELALTSKPYLDAIELTRVQLMHELGYGMWFET